MQAALSNAYLASFGLPALTAAASLNPPNPRMRTRLSGGVAGESGRPLPHADLMRLTLCNAMACLFRGSFDYPPMLTGYEFNAR
jgi:hypothetical protein